MLHNEVVYLLGVAEGDAVRDQRVDGDPAVRQVSGEICR